MIITCEECSTRFRVPDDKITADGVKVRCSRCKHVFVARKDEAAAAKKQRVKTQSMFRLDDKKEAEAPKPTPASVPAPAPSAPRDVTIPPPGKSGVNALDAIHQPISDDGEASHPFNSLISKPGPADDPFAAPAPSRASLDPFAAPAAPAPAPEPASAEPATRIAPISELVAAAAASGTPEPAPAPMPEPPPSGEDDPFEISFTDEFDEPAPVATPPSDNPFLAAGADPFAAPAPEQPNPFEARGAPPGPPPADSMEIPTDPFASPAQSSSAQPLAGPGEDPFAAPAPGSSDELAGGDGGRHLPGFDDAPSASPPSAPSPASGVDDPFSALPGVERPGEEGLDLSDFGPAPLPSSPASGGMDDYAESATTVAVIPEHIKAIASVREKEPPTMAERFSGTIQIATWAAQAVLMLGFLVVAVAWGRGVSIEDVKEGRAVEVILGRDTSVEAVQGDIVVSDVVVQRFPVELEDGLIVVSGTVTNKGSSPVPAVEVQVSFDGHDGSFKGWAGNHITSLDLRAARSPFELTVIGTDPPPITELPVSAEVPFFVLARDVDDGLRAEVTTRVKTAPPPARIGGASGG